MKYKALLMGNNKSMIDDIFLHLTETFECQNTSNRYDDIACHLKYFQPNVVIYCMSNETRETMQQLIAIKRGNKVTKRTPFVIIATQEDCDEFRKMSIDTADLELVKPITAIQIAERITGYLEENYEAPAPEPAPAAAAPEPVKAADNHSALFAELDSMLSGGAPKASNARKHVLVIDDDFRMLKLVKRYLEDSYDVATAVNGKVAMKFLESKMTNLILLDYEMPDENGPAVLEKLRANPITSQIPVIFLTGINEAGKIRQVLALKPQGYLLKPIDHDKLIEAIQNTIG